MQEYGRMKDAGIVENEGCWEVGRMRYRGTERISDAGIGEN